MFKVIAFLTAIRFAVFAAAPAGAATGVAGS
jgi:hypothetical protein